ncbi:Adenylate cyclase 1 [Thermoflexales bacterium]|nr:Adenylate cyclase 1 [Thermoflexales bacterium]
MVRDFHYRWEWRLRSTPEQLWPYVSDTHHFNRVAVGYTVHAIAEDDAGVQQVRAQYFAPLAWDEHPFEWERPYRFGVVRRFHGPILRDFIVNTTLVPNASGTLLRYEVTARPATFLGRVAIPLQIGLISRRRFEHAFRQIDEFLQHPIGSRAPFAAPRPFITGEATHRMQDIARSLSGEGYPTDLIERLIDCVSQADDEEVAHLRPYALADRWGAPRRIVLELCLAATRHSLLDLRWDVVCPMCRGAKTSVPQLSDVHDRAHCPSCRMDFDVNFDHTLEVTFRPNAVLRRVELVEYCVGGPQLTPHVVAQQIMAPGETRTIQVALDSGAHRVRARSNLPHAIGGHLDLHVTSDPAEQPASTITLQANAGGWSTDRKVVAPAATITLSNHTPAAQGVVIERVAWNDQAVTAAEVSTVQAFRDWFATQALRPDVQLGITHLAILFTDLRDSTQLYRLIGDAPAFGRVLEHFDVLRRSVDDHAGALIKTIGDAIMAAFLDPAQGVAAALDILRGMAALNRTRTDYPLRLKMGLHAGPAIAVTLNERLDYFGTTVNIASRLEGQAQGDDLIVSTEVLRQPAVQRLLRDNHVASEEFKARLKGFIDEEFQLHRIKLGEEQRGK